MCGIAGIYDWSGKRVSQELLTRMGNVLHHRGPDDSGFHIGDKIGLAHRRLSIIDLSTGKQPMYNETGDICVVFNGEIYNFQELRPDLEKKGHRFATHSDTEVIIHLYEEYGPDCVKFMRGMFAFAIWDARKEELFIARDRLGKKPLYYYLDGSKLVFGSEIKAILEDDSIRRAADPVGLHYYLTYQYVPAPHTAFQGIKKLPPASWMLVKPGKTVIETYWHLSFAEKLKLPQEEYQKEIRRLLFEATKLRMISDVPLGAFLSGGIDSSIIVGIMSQLSSQPVKTFTIGFEEKDYNEAHFAKIIADRFHTDHHEMYVQPKAIEILPQLIWHYDQPYADVSALPSYYVARETRKFVTVALNGDGGDENFAGYGRYMAHMFVHYYYYQKLPDLIRKKLIPGLVSFLPESFDRRSFFKKVKRFVQSCALSPQERNFILLAYYEPSRLLSMYTPGFAAGVKDIDLYQYQCTRYAESGSSHILDQIQYTDFMTYLPEDLMVKMDVATMANSLETRSPFLDHLVVEYAAKIPAQLKLNRRLVTKYILKETFKDMLPPEILNRSKMGFGVPIGRWFRGELKDYMRDILLSEKFYKRGIFTKEAINNLVKEHLESKAEHGERLWALLNMELWFRLFIDREKI
jgi:asparagine synthase (glutamine-hydrolysing)